MRGARAAAWDPTASCATPTAEPMEAKVQTSESADLPKVCHEVAERSSKILGEFANKQAESMSAAVRDEMGIAKAYMDLYTRMAADPAVMASVTMSWWMDSMRLW